MCGGGGGFYTKLALKIKSKEAYVLVLYHDTNKSNKTHPGDAGHEQFFISLISIPRFFSSEVTLQ